jgi:hypothetical protein
MRFHVAMIVAALAAPALAQDPVAPVGSNGKTVMIESVTDSLDFDHAKKYAHAVAGDAPAASPCAPTAPAGASNQDPTVVLAKTINAAHAQDVATQVQASYGVRPRRWLGYLDTTGGTGDELAHAVEHAAALTNGKIAPTWLYTVAIGEGMSYWSQGGGGGVSGFGELGVDNFGTRAAALKAEGYLPQSFTLGRDYTLDKNTNEKGETVTSANFPNAASALVALQAMLQESRARAIANAKAVYGANVQLSEDDIRFWTYFDFNCGGTRAK